MGTSEIQRRGIDPVLQIPAHVINTELATGDVGLSRVANVGHIHKLFPQLGFASSCPPLHVSRVGCKENNGTVFLHSLACAYALLAPSGRS